MWLFGHEINLIWSVLAFFSIYMVIFSFLINLLEPYTPKILSDTFGYGKTTNENLNVIVRLIQVPKSYFFHFYIFAVILMGLMLIQTFKVAMFGHPVPVWLEQTLNFLCFESASSSTTPEAVIIVMSLMNIQCWRRLYECLYVNVDTGSKMNILHYIVGLAHYFCCAFGYISESPGFAKHPELFQSIQWIHIEPRLTNVTIWQISAVVMFAWAWKHQLTTHQILADLKKSCQVTHSVPHGDWFQYVSCPHYMAEIIIYLSLAIIMGQKHRTGWIIFAWVLTNQMVAGLMSHLWYRKTFRTYPSNRKAVIPFLI